MKERAIPESAILSACLKWLWANGVFCWRNNTGAYRPEGSGRFIRFGKKGSADIIGVNPHGRFVAVETKRKGKKLETHQEQFKQMIQEKFGVFVLAHSIDDLEANRDIILSACKIPNGYADGVPPKITAKAKKDRQEVEA